nr:hypothetical protein 25 [Elusimicrobiota bacterium]
MADILFLSKNYLNADCTVNVSSNDSSKLYAYDQKRNTLWRSSGETDEDNDYSCFYEVEFYNGSDPVSRTVDTFVLQNINLKKFKIQYYNGGGYVDIPGAGFINNASASLKIKLSSSITTSKIRLAMDSTIIAGQEKKIGEFWIMQEKLELKEVKTSRNRADHSESGHYYLASGKLETWNIFDKYNATWTIDFVDDSVYYLLKDIYDAHEEFTFYPDYERNTNEIYLVQWTGNWRSTDNPKIQRHSVTMELKEQ